MMTTTIIFLLLGFALLVFGANYFVDGSAALAKNFKFSPLIIGLTIVAAGTSAPELAVSISAAAEGSNEIALSNVIGSNIFNLLAILGVCSIIAPLFVENVVIIRDFTVTTISTLILFTSLSGFMIVGVYPPIGVLANENVAVISRLGGFILLSSYIIYVFYIFAKERKSHKAEYEQGKTFSNKKCLGLIIIGLIMIISGGKLVVHSAKSLALLAGMSETLVGLTIVAIGTSLPELVTSIIATKKGQLGIALGNVLGSNIFNLLFILGVSAIISPITVNAASVYDLLILLIATTLTWIFAYTKYKLNRLEGAVMLTLYILSMTYAIIR